MARAVPLAAFLSLLPSRTRAARPLHTCSRCCPAAPPCDPALWYELNDQPHFLQKLLLAHLSTLAAAFRGAAAQDEYADPYSSLRFDTRTHTLVHKRSSLCG